MKIFILLILVSCGQYQKKEGKQDQKNMEHLLSESTFKKFDLAVSGVMSLTTKNIKSSRIDIPFSNFLNPKTAALKILTSNEKNLERFSFDPFSKNLVFEFEPKEYQRLLNDDYQVTFFFKNGSDFTVSHQKEGITEEVNLKNKNFFTIQMNKEELIDIFKGNKKIEIKSKQQASIDEWNYYLTNYHYPVLINDTKKNEIIFLKNQVTFEDFQKKMGIKNIINIEDISLFSPEIDLSTNFWFTRNSNSNTKILFRSNMKTISDFYKNSLFEKTDILRREKGITESSLNFKKNKNALFYLTISGKKRFHKIPFVQHKFHKSGIHFFQVCEQFITNIQYSFEEKLSLNEIINNLELITEAGVIDLKRALYIKENISNEGPSWIFAFDEKVTKISLRIKPNNSKAFEAHGIQKRGCLGKNKNAFKSFHFENQLDLMTSVFVEIIE